MEKMEKVRRELKKIIERNNALERGLKVFFRWLVERPIESRKTMSDWSTYWCETFIIFIPFQSSQWIHPEEERNWNLFQKEVEE